MINETPTLNLIEVMFTHGFIKIILLVWTPLIVALLMLALIVYKDEILGG